MTKKILIKLPIIALIFSLALCLFACGGKNPQQLEDDRDFVSELKLDMTSESLKQEVTVSKFVDGDTTHFIVPSNVVAEGVLQARYLAINTPESTGKIEEWGKAASKFTKEILSNATNILIESDDNKWNLDSTGGRYLVWVWYKTSEDGDYRNLNLEILQNGYAFASNSGQNRYGDICLEAIAQARKNKLHVYSDEKDPDFYYGEAIELTLKELRLHVVDYVGLKVAFEGNVIRNHANTIYLEDFDEETGLYFGISVYLGYNLNGEGLEIVNAGNRSRIVGTVQYYEAGETYQVSGLQYRAIKPNDPSNIKLIKTGVEPGNPLFTVDSLLNGKVTLVVNEETGEKKVMKNCEAMMSTSVKIEGLYVKSTRVSDTGTNKYMILTCEQDGKTITIKSEVFYNEDGSINYNIFKEQTIDVLGIVDYYSGSYQLRIFSEDDVRIH